MDLAQQGTTRMDNRQPRVLRISPLVMGAALTAVVASSYVAWLVVGGASSRLAPAAADPFIGPAAVEFRQGERAAIGGAAQVASDPFIGPAAVEFRQGEHAAAAP